jgi:hypothetical protein
VGDWQHLTFVAEPGSYAPHSLVKKVQLIAELLLFLFDIIVVTSQDYGRFRVFVMQSWRKQIRLLGSVGRCAVSLIRLAPIWSK